MAGEGMRSRVARAIYDAAESEARKLEPSMPATPYEQQGSEARGILEIMADAAIAVIIGEQAHEL